MSAAGCANPVKRSFSIRGHRTSISLETPFWEALKNVAAREGVALAVLVTRIDEERGSANQGFAAATEDRQAGDQEDEAGHQGDRLGCEEAQAEQQRADDDERAR